MNVDVCDLLGSGMRKPGTSSDNASTVWHHLEPLFVLRNSLCTKLQDKIA